MMTRILLVFTLLIAASLACAPHSPRRPSRPVKPKDCPTLAPWADSECETELSVGGKMYECSAFTANPTTFTCTGEASPVVYGTFHKILNSITCDRTTGGWVYDTNDDVLTDGTLATAVGDSPYLFACAEATP